MAALYRIVSDENVDEAVLVWLRSEGHNAVSVRDLDLRAASDDAILHAAMRDQRIVLTHDSDFGYLLVRTGIAPVGIIFIRPGDAVPGQVIEALRRALASIEGVSAPFIVVAAIRPDGLRVRLRRI